jgi:hypothetical protein
MFGSSMGKLTIEQSGAGWIVCEDGRRVGGTVRHPFTVRRRHSAMSTPSWRMKQRS